MNNSLFLKSCFEDNPVSLAVESMLSPIRESVSEQRLTRNAQCHTSPRPNYRVLIIEADHPLAQRLECNFARAGVETRIAGNGIAGLEALQAHAPHIALIDLALPDLDAMMVCKQMRAAFEMPIIALGAQPELERVAADYQSDIDEYISKPFDTAVIAVRTIALLRRTYRYENGHLCRKTHIHPGGILN